jgi:hypothetical protein
MLFLKLVPLFNSDWLDDDNPVPIDDPAKDDVNNEPED